MIKTSYKIADHLFLVHQSVDTDAPAKPMQRLTNHLLVVDCSGSMAGDLPRLRAQLKKKLPKLLADGDTLSVIWFSGRGEFGTLLEAEPVSTLVDLKGVETAIDRWLRPNGLTGFKEPLEEVGTLVARIRKKRPGSVFSLVFMSDGCDNQWSRAQVLAAVDAAGPAGGSSADDGLAAATFVEYGYYADRPLLTAMAERAGGQLIFAEDFDRYVPLVEAALAKRPTGGKRISVKVRDEALLGFVWTEGDGDLTTYRVLEKECVQVPEQTKAIAYLSNQTPMDGKFSSPHREPYGRMGDASPPQPTVEPFLRSAYAALSLFSVRRKPEIVLPILRVLGDAALIGEFGSLFGKQRYTVFMEAAKAAAFDPSKRYVKGYNPKAVPRDDAFSVLGMLRLLQSDDDNRILADHPAFAYRRIGRERVDALSVLTKEEQAQVDTLTEAMSKTKSVAKIKELTAEIAAITDKPTPLRFEPNPCPEGYPISNLTWNEEKANVSILLRREGHVDLSARLPEPLCAVLPFRFPTFTFRNYTVVKDGIVHVQVLPVRLSAATLAALAAETDAGRLPAEVVMSEGSLTLIHLDKLPVINRTMVEACAARPLFEAEWSLLGIQAQQKVYNSMIKELGAARKSPSYLEKYGAEAADWLRDAGFTDSTGFNPSKVQTESTDFYMAKELSVKIKGYSSLPSLNEYREKVAKGKLNPPALLMKPAFDAASAYAKGKTVDEIEVWLKDRSKSLDHLRRSLIVDKAQAVFTTTVGGTWFTDLPPDEDKASLTLTLGGQDVVCTAQAREVEVKI